MDAFVDQEFSTTSLVDEAELADRQKAIMKIRTSNTATLRIDISNTLCNLFFYKRVIV